MNKMHLENRIEWREKPYGYQIVSNGACTSLHGLSTEQVQGQLRKFLDSVDSFGFCSRMGYVGTFRKEKVQRGGEYWRVYKKIDGKLCKKYVGKPDGITLETIEAVTQHLAGGSVNELRRAKERREARRGNRDFKRRFSQDTEQTEQPQTEAEQPRKRRFERREQTAQAEAASQTERPRKRTREEALREVREKKAREQQEQEAAERERAAQAEREQQEQARKRAEAAAAHAQKARDEARRRRAEQKERERAQRAERERQGKQQEAGDFAQQRWHQAEARMREAEKLWGWAKNASPRDSFAWKAYQQWEQAQRDYWAAFDEYLRSVGLGGGFKFGGFGQQENTHAPQDKQYSVYQFPTAENDKIALSALELDHMPTLDELDKHRRKLAVKYHPDKFASMGKEEYDKASKRMTEINSAYDYLVNVRKVGKGDYTYAA